MVVCPSTPRAAVVLRAENPLHDRGAMEGVSELAYVLLLWSQGEQSFSAGASVPLTEGLFTKRERAEGRPE